MSRRFVSAKPEGFHDGTAFIEWNGEYCVCHFSDGKVPQHCLKFVADGAWRELPPQLPTRAYSAWLAMLPERRKLWSRPKPSVWRNEINARPLTIDGLSRAIDAVRNNAPDPLRNLRDELIRAEAEVATLSQYIAGPEVTPAMQRAAERLNRVREAYRHAEQIQRQVGQPRSSTPIFYSRTKPRFF